MARLDLIGSHLTGALDGGVEVVDLEPQQDAVSVGPVIRITDRPVMVMDLEAVELKHQHTIADQPLVLGSAMCAPAAQEALIPLAARLDVGHGNERLGTRRGSFRVDGFRFNKVTSPTIPAGPAHRVSSDA